MNTEKILRESKIIILISLAAGLALLAAGLYFQFSGLSPIPNVKALTGLSFIPLGVALAHFIKYKSISRHPEKNRSLIVSENDERLVAVRNEASALAFRIFRGILFLAYFGYTLIVPDDIFVAAGWWILLGLFFAAFMLQGIFLAAALRKNGSGKGPGGEE